MKKLKLILLASLALLSFSASAASFATNQAAGTTLLLSGYTKINAITIQNMTVTNAGVRFVDSPNTFLVWTNGAYTNKTLTGPTQVVTTYTNIFGTIESETNLTLTTTLTGVAANTNVLRNIVAIVGLPASSTVTFTPVSGAFFNLGLLMSNTVEVNVTVDYNK